ncbi:MAG: hypothetical protein P1U87_13835 [Verrucomicrobiales bacterium]|nr:hypothetical protein [Verrucomicrobiales bacterium]
MCRVLLMIVCIALASGAAGAGESKGNTAIPQRPIDAEGYLRALGILALRVYVPEADETGSKLSPHWKLPGGKQLPAQLDLKELPSGQEVHLFLWVDDWSGSTDSGGIRYVVQFKSARKRYERRSGRLPLPPAFRDLTTILSKTCEPGRLYEGGSILLMERSGDSCELSLFSPVEKAAASLEKKSGARSRDINPVELYFGTGVLGWRILLDSDLGDSEYLDFEWSSVPGGQKESGFSFEGFPPGREVEAYIFTEEWREGSENGAMRYRTRYLDPNGKEVLGSGEIRVPQGFNFIYSYLQAGDRMDIGWMLYLLNENTTPNKNTSLEAVYRFAE